MLCLVLVSVDEVSSLPKPSVPSNTEELFSALLFFLCPYVLPYKLDSEEAMAGERWFRCLLQVLSFCLAALGQMCV